MRNLQNATYLTGTSSVFGQLDYFEPLWFRQRAAVYVGAAKLIATPLAVPEHLRVLLRHRCGRSVQLARVAQLLLVVLALLMLLVLLLLLDTCQVVVVALFGRHKMLLAVAAREGGRGNLVLANRALRLLRRNVCRRHTLPDCVSFCWIHPFGV